MPSYKNIQPLSFQIVTEAEGMQLQYERLALPDEFKNEALIAYQQQKPKAKNLPINDLNRLTRLILPDAYSIDSHAGQAGKNWLRAASKSIDPRAIRIIIHAWMHAHNFQMVSLPNMDELQWQPETVRLDDWGQHPNGTAKAMDEAIYDLLPNLLAHRIVGQPLIIGGNPLLFYQVAKDPGGKGVGLISWPPLSHEDFKGDVWFYSYYLDIALATVPFMPIPQINVYLGIRRWISRYYEYLPRERLSVYIRATLPYLSGIQSAHNFQVITAKIHLQSDKKWRLVWSDTLPEMLTFLNLNPQLPDPEYLRKSPIENLKRQDMPNTAIVYSSRITGVQHEVAPGVSPADRYDLIQALTPHWRDWLTLVKPRAKVARKGKGQNNPFYGEQQNYYDRWARLQQQHKGGPIAIEVHYQNETSRDAMLDTLANLFDLKKPILGTHKHNGLTLIISTRQLGAIGAELRHTKGDTIGDVAQKRRGSVLSVLGVTEVTTIALVEILGKERYVEGTDPKQTLRSAFAHTGRLTQFFNPVSEKEREDYSRGKKIHRFYNAALDGLRQLGVHTAGYPVENSRWQLNGWGWNAAGYWLVRQSYKQSKTNQQHFLPTLVLIDGESGVVYAWVNGMEEMRPYHEVLLLAGQGKLAVIGKQNEIANRLPQDLDKIGLNRDVVLVVDAAQSNMRYRVWRWLQDQRISLDEIEFNDGQKWHPEDRPNLRVVRVRSVEHETPEWYAKSETVGLSAGLYKISDRTFISISKTATTQRFSRDLTKTNTANASKSTPSPGYYELTVGMMQSGDRTEEVADFVHSLRDASTQYQDETAHALPLHLGKLIEEYLLWIEEEARGEDFDQDEEE